MEGIGDTGEGRAEEPQGRRGRLGIRKAKGARKPKGPREGTWLQSQGHPVEAGTTVAVSGTGEGRALQQELEPQKRETA